MALNLTLAFAWVLVTGEFSPTNALAGFVLGYFALRMVDRMEGADSAIHHYVHFLPRLIRFSGYFLRTILEANLAMGLAVLRPLSTLSPAIVAVPLDLTNPVAITLFANWITLTPGTLSLDVSDDQSTLFVHTFQCEDEAAFVAELKHNFERRILELFE